MTKDIVSELIQSDAPSLGVRVEQYTGQSLGAMVESGTGKSLGQSVEESIPMAAPKGQESAKPKAPLTVTAADLLLETAIDLALEDENRLLNVIDDLYPTVAEIHHATLNCVQKNMRMAIIAGWKNGGNLQLEKLLGLPFRNRPVTKDFIDLLADYLRRRR